MSEKQTLVTEAIRNYIKDNPDKAADFLAEELKNLYRV